MTMCGEIRYLDPDTDEIRVTHGRVLGIMTQGGLMPHRVAVIDRGKSILPIPVNRLVDKSILDGALVL